MLKAVVSDKGGIRLPAYSGDVGFDLVAVSPPRIVGERDEAGNFKSIDFIEYDTEVRIQPPVGFHSLIFPRSSISKYDLVLANSVGVIDESYRGNLLVRFKYVIQPQDLIVNSYGEVTVSQWNAFKKIYKQGDKIAQLVFAMSHIPDLVEGTIGETERGAGNFGSSGQ